jgi:uncharacterized protein (DUF1778 family)
MRSALKKAEQALAEQTRFVLGETQWKAFLAALDRPAKNKPCLRRLFREPHVAKRVAEEVRADEPASRFRQDLRGLGRQ